MENERNYYRVKISNKYFNGMRRYNRIAAKKEFIWLTGTGVCTILLYRILLFFNLIPDNRYSDIAVTVLSCAMILGAAVFYIITTNKTSEVDIRLLTEKMPNYLGTSAEYFYFASFGDGVGNKEDEKWLKKVLDSGYVAHGTKLRKIIEENMKRGPYRTARLTCLKQIVDKNFDYMTFLLSDDPFSVMDIMDENLNTERNIDGSEIIHKELPEIEKMIADKKKQGRA